MKLDVEGAEASVLRGSKCLLSENEIELFIEMHPGKLRAMGDVQTDVIVPLRRKGYHIDVYLEHRNDATAASIQDIKLPDDGDYLLHAYPR